MDQPSPVLLLNIAEIDPDALLRDRTALDPQALRELQHSIATQGLRSPIEVWQFATPRGEHRYGLISGLRRLTAARGIGMTTIAAFLRTPETIAEALTAMVTENEIRAPVSPWEKASLIINAIDEGHFDTADQAIATLFRSLSRTTQGRIRSHVRVVEDLGAHLADPASLSIRRIDMIAAALATGHQDLLIATLNALDHAGAETQWAALRPILLDVLREPTNPRTNRPRRHLRLPQGLTITREPTQGGWLLRFSGPQARRPGLVDDVLDMVEQWLAKG